MEISYSDETLETFNATVTVSHMGDASVNYSLVQDTQESFSDSTFTFTWGNGKEGTDYYANITAYKFDKYYTWVYPLLSPQTASDPWAGVFELFGVWPVPAQYFLGIILILSTMAVFSTASRDAGLIISCMVAGLLNWIRWVNVSWSLIGLALAFAVLEALHTARKRERFSL